VLSSVLGLVEAIPPCGENPFQDVVSTRNAALPPLSIENWQTTRDGYRHGEFRVTFVADGNSNLGNRSRRVDKEPIVIVVVMLCIANDSHRICTYEPENCDAFERMV
jgi:hypothetical protein